MEAVGQTRSSEGGRNLIHLSTESPSLPRDAADTGFRSFSELLERMEKQNMVMLEHDRKSGGYIITDYMGA